MPPLFNAPREFLGGPPQAPAITTPLGDVRLGATIEGVALGEPSAAARLSSPPGIVFSWERPAAQVELLIAALPATRPDAHVDGCLAAVWRVRVVQPVHTLELECRWAPRAHYTEVGPESGEALDAQTWRGAQTRVTIGTLDCDALTTAARDGLLPARWADQLGPGAVRYEPDGLVLALPAAEPGEQCQAHFIVAWAPQPEPEDDVATWLAVDRSPQALRRLLAPAV